MKTGSNRSKKIDKLNIKNIKINRLAEFFNQKQANKTPVMNIDNTQSQMRKGVLEFCILSIIRQGEVYPSDIVEKMKKANLNILEGTLNPFLTEAYLLHQDLLVLHLVVYQLQKLHSIFCPN